MKVIPIYLNPIVNHKLSANYVTIIINFQQIDHISCAYFALGDEVPLSLEMGGD